MEAENFKIGAKVEHPQFGVGIVTRVTLTTMRIFFLNRGDKDISVGFQGLKLLEPSACEDSETGTPNASQINLSDLEKVFTMVLKRYADFPALVELGDKWKRGVMVLKPGASDLKPKEIPIDAFFHKIVLIRDRIRVLEQRINSSEKLDDEEKVNLQQYITRVYGSLTTFNVLFKHKEQYFIGERGGGE